MTRFNQTKIMMFGTFDILHKGHLNFFKQARKLSKNSFIVVSVARDVNVQKIKGRKPKNSEQARLKSVLAIKAVNKAVLGGVNNYLRHIVKERPDIIALGYDQKAYTQNLKNQLTKLGLNVKIVRLKAFKPKIYKSSKLIKL